MMMFPTELCTLLAIAISVNAAKLPSHMRKCDKKDPNFGQCAIDVAHESIPKLVNGYKELQFPPISPFHVNEIGIEASDQLRLKLTDVDLLGMEKAKFLEISCDFDALTCKSTIFFPLLDIKGTYEIDGQIMVLPIKGQGPANIKIVDGTFDVNFDWTLYKKNGVDYAKIGNVLLNYTTKKTEYHFDNLFNGDAALGKQMNDFLNENWKDLSKELQPAVSRTIQVLMKSLFSRFTETIAYDDLFL